MWAAKLPGEGAALYRACDAMCRLMSEIGIAIDGGKDSLSMAARVDGSTIKAPGMLVVLIRRQIFLNVTRLFERALHVKYVFTSPT